MLLHLKITNLATIQQLEVDFQQGFSILTGETGAGKSIIIDAIHWITGQKADASMIRSGQPQATVEAIFDISQASKVRQALREAEIEEDGELIVRRIVQENGRQKIWLNDTVVTRAKLESIGEQLVTIHGQHDNQALLQVGEHLHFLDGFARLESVATEVKSLYSAYQASLKEYQALQQRLQARTQRLQELHFQQAEIEKASLQPHEDEALAQEAHVLNYAEKLIGLLGQIQQDLYESDGSAVEKLGSIQQGLGEATRIDPRCASWQEPLETSLVQLKEIYRGLSDYTSRLQADPERLEWINKRLSQIQSLKRKYGGSVEQVLQHGAQVQAEIAQLEHLEESEQQLKENMAQFKLQLRQKSESLSAERQKAAGALDEKIMNELHQLGMEKAVFRTQVQAETPEEGEYRYSAQGIDRVEFLLSVNPGQELRSLVKVASGGELSRIMLALKTVLVALDTVDTLIFDEIDTGISGRIAEIVGQKLHSLGEARQALCITHLPQIVAYAQHHFVITKSIREGATFTTIHPLQPKEKMEELARLMGGTEITAQTRKLAAEMLERARQKSAS